MRTTNLIGVKKLSADQWKVSVIDPVTLRERTFKMSRSGLDRSRFYGRLQWGASSYRVIGFEGEDGGEPVLAVKFIPR